MTRTQDSGTTSSGLVEMQTYQTYTGKQTPISGHSYPVSINQLFLDTFSDIGCEQIVDFPTRVDNTLDIFGANRPSIIERCVSPPDKSGHDIVHVDSWVLPARKKPVRRKVYLSKKAKKQAMEEGLAKFTEKFTKDFSTSYECALEWLQSEMH